MRNTNNGAGISSRLWLAFSVCFISNILGGTVSTLMSVYLPVVVGDLLGNVDADRLNFVSAYINSTYILGWTVGGLTWGWIGDKVGRSKALAMSVACFGMFTMLTGLAGSWELVVFLRFVSGFGVGGMMVVSVILLSEVFPERSRSIFVGILSIGFPIGIFSAGLVNVLVSGWRQGFLFGMLPLALSLLSFWGVQESEKWKHERRSNAVSAINIFQGGHAGNLWKGTVIFGSMLIGLWAIFSWLPTWVQSLLTNSDGQQERGRSMMLLGAGGLTGGFFSGWISNGLGVRKAMIVCFAGCSIMSILLFWVNRSFTPVIYVEIAVLSLFFGASQGLLSIYITELFPTSIRSTATGFCFNVGRLFTAAAVFFVGALVTTLGGYGNSLLVFSLIFFFGLITILITKNSPAQHGTH